MVPDRQKGWTDGRTEGRTDGRTDDAKTISLRLRRGIINQMSQHIWFWYLLKFQEMKARASLCKCVETHQILCCLHTLSI